MKTLGIIGGMGPEATVDFQRRLLDATAAHDDADHFHVLVDNNPQIPSRIRALVDGDGLDPGPAIAGVAKGLAAAGAELLAMPCNTAHHYLGAIRAATDIPVLDMVVLATDALARLEPRPTRIGMLASPALRITGLYDPFLTARRMEPVHCQGKDANQLLWLIQVIKAGQRDSSSDAHYLAIADGLRRRGADALLVACSELSLLPPPELGVPVIDSIEVLVVETVKALQI